MGELINKEALKDLIKDVLLVEFQKKEKNMEKLWEHISELKQEIFHLRTTIDNMAQINGY